jgi:hypothetical protein
MYELNPRKMEELVGSVFRDYYGCEVRHVGRTGDGGIDILLIEAESEVVVQVKRRISKRAAEGVSLVREVVGATLLSGRHQAAIVTTGSFTRGSKDAAESAVALGVLQRLELIDMARFIEMLNLTSKAVELPWQRALKDKVYGVDRAGVICDECKGRRFTGRKIYTRLSGRGTTEEVHEALNCKRCNGAGRLKPISLLGESNIQQRIFLYSY